MKNSSGIAHLLFKYLQKDLTTEESAQLQNWIDDTGGNKAFFEEVTQPGYVFFEARYRDETDKEIDLNESWQKLAAKRLSAKTDSRKITTFHWIRYAAAAAIVFLVAIGVYLWSDTRNDKNVADTKKEAQSQQEIMPADGFAILVLDDGRKVVLDSLNNGVVGSDGGKEIVKQEDQLTYQGKAKEIVYNTLLTTKGKVMNLTLADGSRIWLNAESSIRFPTEFTGNERRVEITGEVYFDVAKNTSNPFKATVKTPSGEKAEVEVLGTHFNINAYSDEATIQTTLIEGKIKISEFAGNDSRIISPGQQAVIDADGNFAVLNSVNTDKVVAWKERNFFYFENNDIKTVMRELTRWFDITVKYESNLPGRTFTGEVNRELSLSAVLKMLEGADVHFAVRGREVIVMQ